MTDEYDIVTERKKEWQDGLDWAEKFLKIAGHPPANLLLLAMRERYMLYGGTELAQKCRELNARAEMERIRKLMDDCEARQAALKIGEAGIPASETVKRVDAYLKEGKRWDRLAKEYDEAQETWAKEMKA